MIFLLVSLLFSFTLSATEKITDFQSAVTIHTDGSMIVREDITVKTEGRQIRRGIVREFPTTYKDRLGNWYTVQFTIKKVLMDGKQSPYFIETVSNGKKLNFGDESFIEHGLHTFTVEYGTNRQLGFFENHDELYWNVTGSGWRLPIEKVMARVQLPSEIPTDALFFDAFTGGYRSREKAVTIRRIPHGVVFSTTRPFQPYEGLTIVVGWPKGYIAEPSLFQKLYWFFTDNLHLFIFLIGLLALIAYCFAMVCRVRKKRIKEPVIPLFYPPEGMMPGGMRYFSRMGFDSTTFAADVVNMGVLGYLTIEKVGNWFGSSRYTLSAKKPSERNTLYLTLFFQLFADKKKITIGKGYNTAVQKALKTCEAEYKNQYAHFFDYHINELFGAFMIGMSFFLVGTLSVALPFESAFFWMFLCAYGLTVYLFSRNIKGYKVDGMRLKNKIDGFKLFLITTETDRLQVIGTPPTKTPELYETYLPYAIALGMEQAWSAQFAPLFKKLAEEGNPYYPLWMIGWDSHALSSSSFSSSFSHGMSSAISSSGTPPGSSSGFRSGSGGGGFSGGGGGGGGGGGR